MSKICQNQLILKLQTGQTRTSSLIKSPIQKSGKNITKNIAKTTQPAVEILRSMRGRS